jgi:hypothetical protein
MVVVNPMCLGNTFKLLEPSKALRTKDWWKHQSGQVNDLGYGDNSSGSNGLTR